MRSLFKQSCVKLPIILSIVLICAPPSICLSAQSPSEERINLNTASVEELSRLPGIGPRLAARIVEHRRKHGPFKRPQDLIIIRRISPKLYRRIAHLIRT